MKSKARVFSGVQPTGQLHIGNYLGALKNWAEIQGEYESIFCIVDLHAITLYQDPKELAAKIRETAALFVAAGIDPEQSSVMVQSSVAEHAELAEDILSALFTLAGPESVKEVCVRGRIL